MKIPVLIVDDEKDARDSLCLLLENFFSEEIEIKYKAISIKEAVKAIHEFKPEIVFLDIEMPNQNGFSLFEYFGENYDFEVIFTTAYNQYALKAIQQAALDYILKPVNIQDLEKSIKRYKKRVKNDTNVKINTFLSNLNNDIEINKKIVFPTAEKYIVEKLDNIVFCEAEVNYSRVNLRNGSTYVITSTLKKLENILPSNLFFRIHKSYLINLNYVNSIDRRNYKVKIDNNIELNIAQKRVGLFLEKISNG